MSDPRKLAMYELGRSAKRQIEIIKQQDEIIRLLGEVVRLLSGPRT